MELSFYFTVDRNDIPIDLTVYASFSGSPRAAVLYPIDNAAPAEAPEVELYAVDKDGEPVDLSSAEYDKAAEMAYDKYDDES